MDLFRVRDSGYLDFLPEGYEVTASRMQELSAPCEHEFLDHYRNWWESAGGEDR